MFESFENNTNKKNEDVDKNQSIENLKEAQEVFEEEFSISPEKDSEEETKDKIEKTVESPTFLEKIRNSSAVRNALKIIILSAALFNAETTLGQDTTQHRTQEKEKIEQVDQRKEIFEKNMEMLGQDEHVVPQDVIVAFAQIVDPNTNLIGVPGGGYFSRDFLDNNNKEELFLEELKSLGYSQETAQKFRNFFTEDKIVFNENELKKEDFREIIEHEKLHKKINHLPNRKERKLNKARDTILKDYKEKRNKWSEKLDSLYQEVESGNMEMTEYMDMKEKIIHDMNPILLDEDGGTHKLMPVMIDSNEFYAYLIMNRFQPSVLDYIKKEFPDSYKILKEMQNEIEEELTVKN